LIYNRNNRYVGTLGTGEEGSGNDRFNRPRAVFVDQEENIYVPDMGNHRIQIFNKDRQYVATIGTGIHGRGNDQFNYPREVYVDASGNIYLAGYTADQTGTAVKELIDDIDSWK